MGSLLSEIGIAAMVFASTNIDDIILLSVLFSDPRLRKKSIVIGQYLGIGVMVAGSSIAAYAAMEVPKHILALLGLIPLALGIKGLIPLLLRKKTEDDDDMLAEEKAVETKTHSQILAVAGVTLANGGDNTGVYIPLFANDLSIVPLYLAVFAVATAVWCLLGYYLVNNRWLGDYIKKYGRVALPIVLIGLGIHILMGYFQQ